MEKAKFVCQSRFKDSTWLDTVYQPDTLSGCIEYAAHRAKSCAEGWEFRVVEHKFTETEIYNTATK